MAAIIKFHLDYAGVSLHQTVLHNTTADYVSL